MGQVAKSKHRANDLGGREWTRLSISVWRNIRKSPEEVALGHPAVFPVALIERLIKCYTSVEETVVLDPFVGSGSTVIAARNCGKFGIGVDISEEYIVLAKRRLGQDNLFGSSGYKLIHGDAMDLLDHIPPASVDLCVTSPPYWDILDRPRTADGKDTKTYAQTTSNLASIHDYQGFVHALAMVFSGVVGALKEGAYCIVNVMDIRKKDRFYPMHCDLAREVTQLGLVLDDIIVWDRSHEYNNLRPLGYPAVFRINKIHEFLLVFRKPKRHNGPLTPRKPARRAVL